MPAVAVERSLLRDGILQIPFSPPTYTAVASLDRYFLTGLRRSDNIVVVLAGGVAKIDCVRFEFVMCTRKW